MRGKRFLFLFCSLFCLSMAFAGVDFTGSLMSYGSMTMPTSSSGFSYLDAGSTLVGVIDAYQGKGAMHLDGSLSYDLLGERTGNGLFSLISGKEPLSLRVREAYFDYYESCWGFRIGRQIVSWGAADSFVLTNVLCPEDSTSLIASDLLEQRLGVDALKVSWNGEALMLDAYWIPFFRPSALPLDVSNPLSSYLVPRTIETPLGMMTVKEFGGDDLMLPALSLENGEYGIRLSAYQSLFDVSFYGFYGFEDTPAVSYHLDSPSEISLHGSYPRMAMVGFDSSIPVGDVTLRLEGAFYPERSFNTSGAYQLGEQMVSQIPVLTEKHHELSLLFGVDWMVEDWTLTAQCYGDYVFGKMENLEKEKNLSPEVSFSVSRDFLGGDATLSFAGLVDLVHLDSALTGSIAYSLSDEMKVSLAGMSFIGGPKEKGKYGVMEDLDSLTIKGSYSF